jgi:hypothetical protein
MVNSQKPPYTFFLTPSPDLADACFDCSGHTIAEGTALVRHLSEIFCRPLGIFDPHTSRTRIHVRNRRSSSARSTSPAALDCLRLHRHGPRRVPIFIERSALSYHFPQRRAPSASIHRRYAELHNFRGAAKGERPHRPRFDRRLFFACPSTYSRSARLMRV